MIKERVLINIHKPSPPAHGYETMCVGDQIREKIYSWTVDEGALVMYTGRIVESKSG